MSIYQYVIGVSECSQQRCRFNDEEYIMIDSHAHIYTKEFDQDRDAMIKRALDAGISKILLPNIDLNSIEPMLATERAYPDICHSMMGIHPCYVKEDIKAQLAHVYTLFAEHKFIAVGEIGLDFYWDDSFKNEQIDAFRTQLQWAKEFDLPVVIHTRDSIDETLAVLEKEQNGDLRGVFHCFVGNIEQAKAINALGFSLGLGGVTTFKNSGMNETIEQLDLDYVILETDCPYLAPTPHRGKRNEPAFMSHIAQKIADLKQMPVEALIEKTVGNTRELFRLE